jgi:hypothetical protein
MASRLVRVALATSPAAWKGKSRLAETHVARISS